MNNNFEIKALLRFKCNDEYIYALSPLTVNKIVHRVVSVRVEEVPSPFGKILVLTFLWSRVEYPIESLTHGKPHM